jgi:hypothetical protein
VSTGPRLVLRRIGAALLALVAVYFVVRGVVELVTVDPSRPETYRRDWGGPSYLGVVLVHAGPGLLAAVLAGIVLVRRGRRRAAARSSAPEDGDRPP